MTGIVKMYAGEDLPSPTYGIVLLIADELIIREHFLCFVCCEHATRAHTDMDDADLLGIALWCIWYIHMALGCVRHDARLDVREGV